MRIPEKLRLWLAFAEDFDNDENPEALATSRAAAGTLASAASDDGVCSAMLVENCATAITKLFKSRIPDLIHRALVIVNNCCEVGGKVLATHLLEGQIIPLIATASSVPEFRELCKETASILSKAIQS